MTGNDIQLFRDNIASETYLHNTIKIALKEIYNIMKECYGPYGSHILIDNQVRPEATKDGKTILSKISISGSIASAVHRSITSVADKQVEEVGDGSTTTILLLCKLYNAFREIIKTKNVSPSVFQKELKVVIDGINALLEDSAEQIVTYDAENNPIINFKKLRSVIHTSVDGDDELTDILCRLFEELNCVDPLVIIENSTTESHSYDLVKGAEIDGTVICSDVFFEGFSRRNYDNPRVLIINGRLELSPERYMELCNEAMRSDTSFIIIATGISEILQNTIIQLNSTAIQGTISRCPIFQTRLTSAADEFLDLCATLGATPVDSDTTKKWTTTAIMMKAIDASAGGCDKALLTEFCARFNNPHTNEQALQARLDDILAKIEDLKQDSSAHNNTISELEDRKAFLSRHYAKFYVGGASPQRKSINYELANDGIPQAISCMKHGIVPGCNTIVPRIVTELLKDEKNDLRALILCAIIDSYEDMFIQLVANKCGSEEEARRQVLEHFEKNGYVPMNIRENDTTDVVNSAHTDRAILTFSTDMAALLATSKAFLSVRGNNEFDIISKGYTLND